MTPLVVQPFGDNWNELSPISQILDRHSRLTRQWKSARHVAHFLANTIERGFVGAVL
jgi:hypothetical protein